MFSMFLAGVAVMSTLVQTTDTTIQVQEGMRLDLRNQAGEIRVTTWRRNAVRIEADRSSGFAFEVQRSGSVIRVRTTSYWERVDARGRRRFGFEDDPDDQVVDYAVTVPAYLHLELSGTETEITVTGVNGDVSAESVEGRVTVRGGGGFIFARSVEETVRVEGARGRVQASSSDGDVWIRNVTGEVTAESIDGDVDLDDVDSRRVTASTVDGNISFTGAIHDDGRYHLSTHDGDVTVWMPTGANATVTVASFDGDFETSFPLVLRESRRRRFNFALGDGSAHVELESFSGDIFLRRGR